MHCTHKAYNLLILMLSGADLLFLYRQPTLLLLRANLPTKSVNVLKLIHVDLALLLDMKS